MTPTRDDIIEVLKECRDTVLPVNIWDLGLIYELTLTDDTVQVVMTLRSQNDTAQNTIPSAVEKKLKERFPECNVSIKVVFEPEWTPERMNQDAQSTLGIQDA